LGQLFVSFVIEQSGRKFRSSKILIKREVKGVKTWIEEFDLQGSVYDWTRLPYKLIQTRLANFTGAV